MHKAVDVRVRAEKSYSPVEGNHTVGRLHQGFMICAIRNIQYEPPYTEQSSVYHICMQAKTVFKIDYESSQV